jgi:hypothetical protein
MVANSITINVAPSATNQTLTLQLEPRPPNWTDISVYAPTVPGLAVAILGLWIAHRFTMARDRRKEILELCEDTKAALGEAESACIKAWLSPQAERAAAVANAKSRLQALGIGATDLRRRTVKGVVTRLKYLVVDCLIAVDVVNDVGRLRDIATNDPFDDATRQPDNNPVSDISAKAWEIYAKIDQQVHQLFG